jgi:hypothetical protein
LEGRAKVYLGVISAFLAAILLKAGDAKGVADALRVPWLLLLGEAAVMTLALLLVLRALHYREYQAVNDGLGVIDKYGDDWPDGTVFYEDRIVDYAVASSRNRRINKQVATQLVWASWMIFVGILYLLAIVTIALWRVR